MNTDNIKTLFVTVIADIVDISEKSTKLTSKDIDTLITNVVSLSKKNMLLKKIYDLEDNINKLKMTITKVNLMSFIEPKKETEEPLDDNPSNNEKDLNNQTKKTVSKMDDDKESIPEITKKTTKKTVSKLDDDRESIPEITKKTKKNVSKLDEDKELIIETAKKTTKKNVSKLDEDKELIIETAKKNVSKMDDEEESIPDKMDKDNVLADSSEQPLHVKRKKIPKQIKTLVWNEYIGQDIMQNKCLCCKKEKIDIRNFHCGHVIADSKGGDLTIKNLRPICAPCNSSMGTLSMNEFTKTFFGWEV